MEITYVNQKKITLYAYDENWKSDIQFPISIAVHRVTSSTYIDLIPVEFTYVNQ